MTRAIKMYWRFDFPFSAEYLDRRGTALKLIEGTVPNFWSQIGEGNAILSSWVGTTDKDNVARHLSLEPSSINGFIEWREGVDLDHVAESESVTGVSKVVDAILKEFHIADMKRVGVRFAGVAKFGTEGQKPVERFVARLKNDFTDKAKGILGSVEDIGMTLEGANEDDLHYRATFGPYAQRNAEMTFDRHKPTKEQYDEFAKNDIFFDVDHWELDTSFAEHTLFRWTKAKVAKVSAFVTICSAFT